MKLEISKNVGESKVRLEYKSSLSKPANTPSYIIDKEKADEFVKKYNNQTQNLQITTVALIIIGAISGAITEIKHSTKTNKIIKAFIGTALGTAIGSIISAFVSYKKKNNLMADYDVYKI